MTQQGTSGQFVLDNLTYDLITIIHEKSKALEAYDKYDRDAQEHQEIRQLLQQIRQQDEQAIQQLMPHLGQLTSGQGSTENHGLEDGSETSRLAST
jgi:DNA-binding GntR family transcriptional regulator